MRRSRLAGQCSLIGLIIPRVIAVPFGCVHLIALRYVSRADVRSLSAQRRRIVHRTVAYIVSARVHCDLRIFNRSGGTKHNDTLN